MPFTFTTLCLRFLCLKWQQDTDTHIPLHINFNCNNSCVVRNEIQFAEFIRFDCSPFCFFTFIQQFMYLTKWMPSTFLLITKERSKFNHLRVYIAQLRMSVGENQRRANGSQTIASKAFKTTGRTSSSGSLNSGEEIELYSNPLHSHSQSTVNMADGIKNHAGDSIEILRPRNSFGEGGCSAPMEAVERLQNFVVFIFDRYASQIRLAFLIALVFLFHCALGA